MQWRETECIIVFHFVKYNRDLFLVFRLVLLYSSPHIFDSLFFRSAVLYRLPCVRLSSIHYCFVRHPNETILYTRKYCYLRISTQYLSIPLGFAKVTFKDSWFVRTMVFSLFHIVWLSLKHVQYTESLYVSFVFGSCRMQRDIYGKWVAGHQQQPNKPIYCIHLFANLHCPCSISLSSAFKEPPGERFLRIFHRGWNLSKYTHRMVQTASVVVFITPPTTKFQTPRFLSQSIKSIVLPDQKPIKEVAFSTTSSSRGRKRKCEQVFEGIMQG